MSAQEHEPSEGCYGCWYMTGYVTRHEGLFIDTRTGRRYCAECVNMLTAFELDAGVNGDAGDPDLAHFHEWATP